MRSHVGGVNTISGRPLPKMSMMLQNSKLFGNKDWVQDYIVLSEQCNIEGIAFGPGYVSQFVSTRMLPKVSNRNNKSIMEGERGTQHAKTKSMAVS